MPQTFLRVFFFSIYGVNDFVFMVFFVWVFLQQHRSDH